MVTMSLRQRLSRQLEVWPFVWGRIAISHTTLVRLCEVHSTKVDEAPEMVAGKHLVTNIPPLLSLFRMWHTTFVVILMKSR